MEVSLRRGRTKVRAPQRAPALPARHHQPARLARVSKLASETHEIPCRTPPCALAGSIILSTAGSVLMSVDTLTAGTATILVAAQHVIRGTIRSKKQASKKSLGPDAIADLKLSEQTHQPHKKAHMMTRVIDRNRIMQ